MAKFVPKENSYLTVSLPGELLRAIVIKVVNENSVIAEITTEPLAKSHNYKFRDIVACRRVRGMFGEDWEVRPKNNISIEELVKQEQEDAAKSRIKPSHKVKKHIRANENRKISTKTSSGNSLGKRKKASGGK